MRNKRFQSLLGHSDEIYFNNSSPDAAGDLLVAGMSLPARASDWWPMCELWSYPYYSLNFVLEGGSGSYRHESGFECELEHGNFFMTMPHIKQHYGPGRNQCWSELYVSFGGKLFDTYLESGVLPKRAPVWILKNPQNWIARWQELLREPRPPTRIATARRTMHFLTTLLEMIEGASPADKSRASGDWFSQACSLLTADTHHKVDLHGIAADLGMSYHTFRSYFARRAGMPPARFRDEHRIKAACEKLRNNPHKTCKQIAFSLGFHSGDHFSAHFKQHMGLSPHAYRKQSRVKNG